jgi:hypothetical protein
MTIVFKKQNIELDVLDGKVIVSGEHNENGVKGEIGASAKGIEVKEKNTLGSDKNNVNVGLVATLGAAYAKTSGALTTTGISASANAGAYVGRAPPILKSIIHLSVFFESANNAIDHFFELLCHRQTKTS